MLGDDTDEQELIRMPKVDPETGNPVSDAPDQADESAAGGKGRGEFVDANAAPPEGTGVSAGPNNAREAKPGATQGEGPELSGPDATGGA
ncbi:MAG: hypothetical protein ABR511_00355 [Acidimicrobiales bacterium]